MKHPSHILSDFFIAERCAGEYQERWKERKRGVFTFRFPPSHLALPSVTLLALRLISSSACNPSKDHWAPVNPGQKPLSALTQLPSGEGQGEAIVLQSQARWRAYSLENFFQMYSFQHSSGVNQSQFLLLKSFYFCSLLKFMCPKQ